MSKRNGIAESAQNAEQENGDFLTLIAKVVSALSVINVLITLGKHTGRGGLTIEEQHKWPMFPCGKRSLCSERKGFNYFNEPDNCVYSKKCLVLENVYQHKCGVCGRFYFGIGKYGFWCGCKKPCFAKKLLRWLLCKTGIRHMVYKTDNGFQCRYCDFFKSRFEYQANLHAGGGW